MSWESAVGFAVDCELEGAGLILGTGDILFSTTSRPALGSTQPPMRRVPEELSIGIKRQGVKLTTHDHLVTKSRTLELYLHSPTRLRDMVAHVNDS
jgi:hypothetical protein